jgi:hypothetical protein
MLFIEIIRGNDILALSGLICVFLPASFVGCLVLLWLQSLVFGFNVKLYFKNRVFKLRYGLLFLFLKLPNRSVIIIEPRYMRGDYGCCAFIMFFNIPFLRLPLIPGYIMSSRQKKAEIEASNIYSCFKIITEKTNIEVIWKK